MHFSRSDHQLKDGIYYGYYIILINNLKVEKCNLIGTFYEKLILPLNLGMIDRDSKMYWTDAGRTRRIMNEAAATQKGTG